MYHAKATSGAVASYAPAMSATAQEPQQLLSRV